MKDVNDTPIGAGNTRQVPLKDVRIDDAYWNRYTRLITEKVLPYQWRILNDKVPDAPASHCLMNFKIAAGDEKGERGGTVFQDSDAAKWLEAVAYSLEWHPDKDLEAKADSVIDIICRAQEDDGYLDTYFQLCYPEGKWNNILEGHELYCAGHMIEAAVAYYEATGKDALLKCVCRLADLIARTFGSGDDQRHACPGHPEVELALVKLFRVTGEKRYLDTAKYFLDVRGSKPSCFIEEMKNPRYRSIWGGNFAPVPEYNQSHLPVRQQTTAEGHAVRAVYLYCAMADVADLTGDKELLDSCKTLWDNMTKRRMYITGGIGSSGYFERFTADWDLPNDSAYCETCASVGLALFALRMARITREAKYIDVCERALYNTVRAGISMEGNRYFYVNPLEVWPASCMDATSRSHVKAVRQKWFDVACCPTNVARTFASLGQYIYTVDGDNLYVNLYVNNLSDVDISGHKVGVKVETDYPRTGNVHIAIDGGNAEFTLNIRVPAFAEDWGVKIGDDTIEGKPSNGWFTIRREWGDDTVDVSFTVKPRWVFANPLVRADCGKAAIIRGPEVYCLEECDNGGDLAAVYVDPGCKITEEWRGDMMGGTMLLHFDGKRLVVPQDDNGGVTGDSAFDTSVLSAPPAMEDVHLTAVPYGSWGNRKEGEMIVWMHLAGI